MAAAALRIGYLLASPELVREIGKAVLPYNVNVFSQSVAEVAGENYESELRPRVKQIVAERERLSAALSHINGLAPVTSQANFILVKSAIDPKRIFTELLTRDILIRDVSGYPMLSEYFRFSVGTPEQNDYVLKAIREVCG
jgi:histidinol-phosphate/aromatic aminotransferase/cobyric acid decarboxylase-like protein